MEDCITEGNTNEKELFLNKPNTVLSFKNNYNDISIFCNLENGLYKDIEYLVNPDNSYKKVFIDKDRENTIKTRHYREKEMFPQVLIQFKTREFKSDFTIYLDVYTLKMIFVSIESGISFKFSRINKICNSDDNDTVYDEYNVIITRLLKNTTDRYNNTQYKIDNAIYVCVKNKKTDEIIYKTHIDITPDFMSFVSNSGKLLPMKFA